MNRYSIKTVFKKIASVPKSAIILWGVLFIAVLYSLISLFTPTYQSLEELQERVITIEQVELKDTYNKSGSRMRLELHAQGITYYVRYPQGHYTEFAQDIKNDLLSGNIRCVQVKIPKQQSLRDRLFNNIRIVELKDQETTYYDTEVEKAALKELRVSNIVFFVLAMVFFVCDTIYLLLVYRIIRFKRRKTAIKGQ